MQICIPEEITVKRKIKQTYTRYGQVIEVIRTIEEEQIVPKMVDSVEYYKEHPQKHNKAITGNFLGDWGDITKLQKGVKISNMR